MDYIRWLLHKLININYRKYLRIVTYRLCVPLSCFGGSQSIQRRLEEIEVSFKELEEKGVELEQTLRSWQRTLSDLILQNNITSYQWSINVLFRNQAWKQICFLHFIRSSITWYNPQKRTPYQRWVE